MSDFPANRLALSQADSQRSPASEGLSPRQFLGLLGRNWRLIMWSGLLVAVVAYSVSKTCLSPQYTASAMIAIDSRSIVIPELQGALSIEATDSMNLVRSERQLLISRALVQSVVEELNLTADPEFNATLKGPTFKQKIISALHSKLPTSFAAALGNYGILSRTQSGSESPSVIMSNVVGAVTHEIGVASDDLSLIVNVSFSAERPDLPPRVVNSLIAQYMAGKVNELVVANRDASVALVKHVEQVHKEIDQLEWKMQTIREKHDVVQVGAGSIKQQQLEEISAALIQAGSSRAQLEANYEQAAILVRTGGAGIDNSDSLNSSIVGALRDQQAAAERRLAQMRTTLGPGHPQRVAAEAELNSARAAVISEAKRAMAGLGAQAAAARQHEAELRDQLAKAHSEATSLSSAQSEIDQLQKDADAQRTLYLSLTQSAGQAAQGGPERPGARVVSLAVAPTSPASPRPKLAAELGLLSGFAFGGLLCTVRRGREGKYVSAVDLEADTGVAVVGVLPRDKRRQIPLTARVVGDLAGPAAEALRSLRGRLRLAGRGSMPRSVLFVGSTTADGSSDVAAAFARVAALDGLRVLLIEGDLKTPKLAGILGVTATRGVIETLEGNEQWQENLIRDNLTAMDLLLVGRPRPEASQLLETMQLQNLLAEASEEYNLVVVDGHPVTQEWDWVTLATIVDAVVLVVAAGNIDREQVRAAIKAISTTARRPPVAAISQAASKKQRMYSGPRERAQV
jgi:succinoglycan biosynthesis transport protein ExoP